MKPATYDKLKWVAQYLLPALGTFYFALCGLWGFPNGEQIVGTITAVDILLGVLLGMSSAKYNKTQDGTLMVDTSNPQQDTYRLSIDVPLSDLTSKQSIQLKVDNSADLSRK